MKKICSSCKIEKNRYDFRRDSSRKDGYQHICKLCARGRARSLYTKKYYKKYRPVQNERISKNVFGINQYKSQGCVKCPEKELVCLDLHHTDPNEKDFTISQARTLSWSKIEKELKKCIVVCRNCHAKLHAGLIT